MIHPGHPAAGSATLPVTAGTPACSRDEGYRDQQREQPRFAQKCLQENPLFVWCSGEVPCSRVSGARSPSEPEHLKGEWCGGRWGTHYGKHLAQGRGPTRVEYEPQRRELGEQSQE